MTRTAVATDDYGHDVRTVVVTDHDDDILDILVIVLEGIDIECHRAADGEHAVVLCREHKPQVLLLDMQVHGLPALEVCRTIRSDPSLEDVRIIMLTSRADAQTVQEVLAAGAETCLIQPVGPIELIEVFRGRDDGLS